MQSLTHAKVRSCEKLKPWPNGTPKSSQLEPSYKIKTCIGGWPKNGTAKSSQLARNNSIVGIRPCSHITTQNNVARVGFSWKTWLELGEYLSLIKFKPTRSNSSRLKPSGWPNDTHFHRSCELGSSWLELG